MPVTKTAKRALRSSKRKEEVNKVLLTNLDAAIRLAKKTKSIEAIRHAESLADRAAKKKVTKKNKASRIKSALSKLTSKSTPQKAVAKSTKKRVKK